MAAWQRDFHEGQRGASSYLSFSFSDGSGEKKGHRYDGEDWGRSFPVGKQRSGSRFGAENEYGEAHITDASFNASRRPFILASFRANFKLNVGIR
jgi:hypothetical protein